MQNLTTPPQPESAEQTTSRLSERHVQIFWERMTMCFGHKWTSSYGEKDDGTWFTGLSDLTVDEIKHGIGKCRSFMENDGWPPTLGQFRELARPTIATLHARCRTENSRFAALPKPWANPELAAREIGNMKKIVKCGAA